MSRYKELVLDALTELAGSAYNSETIRPTKAVGLKERLKSLPISLVDGSLAGSYYRIIRPASRVLQLVSLLA